LAASAPDPSTPDQRAERVPGAPSNASTSRPESRRKVPRLGYGVLDVARADLEVGLVGEPLEETVGRKGELERQPGEELADLTRLAGTARRDEELHARSFRTRSVVDCPSTSGTRTMRPPHPSTSTAPTIASRA